MNTAKLLTFTFVIASCLVSRSWTLQSTSKWLTRKQSIVLRSVASEPLSSSPTSQETLKNKWSWNRDGPILNIFIVDCSFPGSINRIGAVQGAVIEILKSRSVRGHASVITCYQNDAEIILEPTSSLLKANRCLSNMKKSVMGNIGRGIEVASDTIDQALEDGFMSEIVVTIISHGKAHGLLSKSANCDSDDMCDLDLLDSATSLAMKSEKLSKRGFSLRTLVINADSNRDLVVSTGEGERLAAALNAHYFHSHKITDDEIIRMIESVRSHPSI